MDRTHIVDDLVKEAIALLHHDGDYNDGDETGSGRTAALYLERILRGKFADVLKRHGVNTK